MLWMAIGGIAFLFFGCSPNQRKASKDNSIFRKIPSDQSGIHFVNRIQANIETKENVFDFDYFYNGSGVAAVDINNDDLLDLVFTANQGPNKLYLNKGNLTFEDITDQSGINKEKGWSTGITYADINRDGWLDLYISQGGPYPGESSRNLLFINQQDLTFKESAQEYGLADPSISSQSAFFDYDKDGDLDCIVMNENMLFGTDPSSFYQILNANEELLHHSSSHLYKNENDRFIDVTKYSGLLSPTFGLGLIISDINEDDWLDIYIANDYYVPDALYINKGNAAFENQIKNYVDQISFFGMGVDIADINADGYQDIFVLDMASTDHYRSKTLMASMDVKGFDLLVNKLNLHYQYMFNSLQLNLGNNHFKNVAQLVGMSKSNWSWAVLMEDFDHNTTTDVFITNGYKKYALNNDIRMKVLEAKKRYDNHVPIEVKRQIYSEMPSEKLPNLMYDNQGEFVFKEVTAKWGLDAPSFSNGAVHADLDNDGDLEIVVNNIDDPAFLYRNSTVEKKGGHFIKIRAIGNINPSFPKLTVVADGIRQKKERKVVRGYLSSASPLLHFGLGDAEKIDSIRIDWLSGRFQEMYNIDVNQTVTFREEEAKSMRKATKRKKASPLFTQINPESIGIDYRHKENEFDDFELETLLPYKQSTLGPCIAIGDVNGDNLDDFFVGGALAQSGSIFLQKTDGSFFFHTSPAIQVDAVHEDTDAVFFDVDNDNDMDLFVVSGGYEFVADAPEYADRLYINDGFGNFQKALAKNLISTFYSGKAVDVLDFDKDGLLDIVVGNRVEPGKYPKASPSILYRNVGHQLVNVTSEIIPELESFGMVNDLLATDFDLDGWTDLIVVGEWTHIGVFKNEKGVFRDFSRESELNHYLGWWFSITKTDVNRDGLPDYVVGNLGLNSKYKTSKKNSLKIYAKDFDDNLTWDIVLTATYKGNDVPFRGRECSSNQMPFIAEKFPTYDMFAKATLEDIYGEELLEAYKKEVNEFRSLLLVNRGNGLFDITPLPIEGQMAPLLDCEAMDLNNDGMEDLILVGNIYNTEVETPRLDAGSGLVLYANGNAGYKYERGFQTGFYVGGNVKSMANLKIKGIDHFIVGRNNGSLAILKYINP